jgi:hypothetical protein
VGERNPLLREVEDLFQQFLREVGDICLLAEFLDKRPVPAQLRLAEREDAFRRLFALRCFEAMRADKPGPLDHWHLFGGRADRIVEAQQTYCDLCIRAQLEEVVEWEVHELEALGPWSMVHRARRDGTPLNVGIRVLPWINAVMRWSRGSSGAAMPTGVRERAHEIERLLSSLHKPDAVLIRKLRAVIGWEPRLELERGEAWSDAAIRDIEALDPSLRSAWIALISHCRMAYTSKPGLTWMKRGRSLLEAVGHAEFASRLLVWLPLVDRPRTAPFPANPYRRYIQNCMIDIHMDVLRGLCWLAPSVEDRDLPRGLGKLALTAYRKAPGVGPRAIKVGHAAISALGMCSGGAVEAAIAQLCMLQIKVKFGGGQNAIEKALNAAAERAGLPRNEIDELGVPSYGLSDVGVREEDFGTHVAKLTVTTGTPPELLFFKRGDDGTVSGKGSKSVPAAVKASHAEDLKELKAAAKDIAAMLPAQRERIDGLFLEDRTWAWGVWRERYLDHPLVGVVARRLIWRVRDAADAPWRSITWLDGHELVDVDGNPSPPIGSAAQVRLWHPIEVDVEEVLAWRRFYESRAVRQPFKQAHREVYVLTDAERRTATYSNRYAAHILKQHQFNTLCALRGWKNRLRLMVDDEYPAPSRTLGASGIRAEFWIEGVGDDYGTDTNDVGVFHYLSTDQVRFYRADAPAAMAHAGGGAYEQRLHTDGDAPMRGEIIHPEYVAQPLETIPPLVFSEIMRDVDLFVGVGSIGNNAQWQDGGPENRFREYWWNYGFADLSASGEGRRDLLERLIPRLKIASKCSFEGRFLVVKGQIRTYKIHLGSGNILMKPNDQYLCIVPDSNRSTAGNVHLPFEGDRMLSIILSKAFMLAEDDKIIDDSITRQIRG